MQIRTIVSFLFRGIAALLMLDAFAAFVLSRVLLKIGSPTPVPPKIVLFRDHAEQVYVTPFLADLYKSMMLTMFVGIPLLFLCGVVLQYVFRIAVFSFDDEES